MIKRLEATEMWFLGRIMKSLWVDEVSNATVLQRVNVSRKMTKTIQSRKKLFLGQVMRRNSTENLMITGKIEGKRARGRQ